MEYHWYDSLGNVGVFLILLAYFLLQIDKIDNNLINLSVMNVPDAIINVSKRLFN